MRPSASRRRCSRCACRCALTRSPRPRLVSELREPAQRFSPFAEPGGVDPLSSKEGTTATEASSVFTPRSSRQLVATARQRFLACSCGFRADRFATDCKRLRPLGSIKAPYFVVHSGYFFCAVERAQRERSADGTAGSARSRRHPVEECAC